MADAPAAQHAGDCAKVGTWLDPATGKSLAPAPLMAALARRPVVLLGEDHDNAEHHRWQLQMLAALHAYQPNMVVGFEMFPRRVQPALDRWAAGKTDAAEFLRESDWDTVWGFDPGLYMPMFHFVRQNRLGMIALNVDGKLTSRVRKEGWAAIPQDQRGGLSQPAPASDAYLRHLAEVYVEGHIRPHANEPGKDKAEAAKPDPASVMGTDDFKRFVAAQLTWDRAMAEAIAGARRKQPPPLVVGVMGQGHARFGHGVPHQLAALGIADAAVLLPMEPAEACEGLPGTIADAVFVVAPARTVRTSPSRPRLGVMIATTDGGVRIMRVVPGSVAEASNLQVRDIIVAAAGRPIEKVSQLIAVVRRQPPGTWLPLKIRRDGRDMDVVAKFPSEAPSKNGTDK